MTFEIFSIVAGTNDLSDTEALPDILQDLPSEIERANADGAYDQRRRDDALNRYRARATISPRKEVRIWNRASGKAERPVRDENLRRIRRVGRSQWNVKAALVTGA